MLNDQTITDLHARAGSFTRRADLLSFEEAAEKLGCSQRTLRYWQRAGKMPSRVRRGRRFFYRASDIAMMLVPVE